MKWILIVATLAVAAFSSCSRDVQEYQSTLPEFAELKVENLSRNSKMIYVGDQVRVTAVQSKKGTLLHRASYTWTLAPHKMTKKEQVVYDKESDNPSWTFTADSAANYTLLLSAEYGISGSGVKRPNAKLENPSGETLHYTVNPLTSLVSFSRSITVFHQ